MQVDGFDMADYVEIDSNERVTDVKGEKLRHTTTAHPLLPRPAPTGLLIYAHFIDAIRGWCVCIL